MIANFKNYILVKLFKWMGGDGVLVEFLAYRITDEKLKFKDVPKSVKAAVKKALEESGLGFLAVEE